MPLPVQRCALSAKDQAFATAPNTHYLTLNTQHLFYFLMGYMLSAELAELVSLQPIRIVLLVLHSRVIPLLTERTSHVDDFTHCNPRYSSVANPNALPYTR